MGWWAAFIDTSSPDNLSMGELRPWYSGLFISEKNAMLLENFLLLRLLGWWAAFKDTSSPDNRSDSIEELRLWYCWLFFIEKPDMLFDNFLP